MIRSEKENNPQNVRVSLIFEPTCANAWWALMHHFPPVCPYVYYLTKIYWDTVQKSYGWVMATEALVKIKIRVLNKDRWAH